MSVSIVDVTADSFEVELRRSGTLLLDCWADWCVPCRTLSPLLERLAPEYEGTLRIAKLDIQAYPQLAERLAVRSIPLLVLFKDGEEQVRHTGTQTLPQLRQWLGRHGIQATAPATATAADDAAAAASLGGAFYGDPELKDFLMQRLRRHAAGGEVVVSRFPFWHEGKGTVSAALVHSQNGQVFERVSGLPFSLGCALHFAGVVAEEHVAEVVGAIRPGSDVDGVAPALFEAWLDDASIDWPTLLEHNPAVVELREGWLRLCRAERAGEAVPRAHWHALREVVQPLRNPRDPRKSAQYAFADMIAGLSPLPEPGDEGAWVGALLLMGTQLQYQILQVDQGWSGEQIATDELRFHWFEQRARRDAEGNLDQEQLRQLRAQWEGENADWMRLNDGFWRRMPELGTPRADRLRARLVELLEIAPPAP